jgi:hypothetical protein
MSHPLTDRALRAAILAVVLASIVPLSASAATTHFNERRWC